MDTLLISLHSRHATNIFDGKKTIELRKNPPRFQKGLNSLAFDRIIIYETLPTAAIVGYCYPFSVTEQNAQMWCDYCNDLCLSPDEIKQYLGDRLGYGIKIRNPRRTYHFPLARMQELGISPPQQYRYLSEDIVKQMDLVEI